MPKLLTSVMLLTFVLAMSGCKTAGGAAKPLPVCPVMPPVPASLMQPPETEKKVRRELFEQPERLTTGSDASRTPSERDKALSEFAKDLAELQEIVDEANREYLEKMTPEEREAMCRLENDLRATAGLPPLDCAEIGAE